MSYIYWVIAIVVVAGLVLYLIVKKKGKPEGTGGGTPEPPSTPEPPETPEGGTPPETPGM